MKSPEEYMCIAIAEALVGVKEGEPPFGSIVVDKNGNIVAQAHDTVRQDRDMTSHAETNVVKAACKKLGPDLSGCEVYTTCEPCPMCFTAIWLSKANAIIFGSYMSDVLEITGPSQRELNVKAEQINELSGSQIKISKEILRDECGKLWIKK